MMQFWKSSLRVLAPSYSSTRHLPYPFMELRENHWTFVFSRMTLLFAFCCVSQDGTLLWKTKPFAKPFHQQEVLFPTKHSIIHVPASLRCKHWLHRDPPSLVLLTRRWWPITIMMMIRFVGSAANSSTVFGADESLTNTIAQSEEI